MSTSEDYDAVREDIKKIIPNEEVKDGFGPIFVRLAWHASGTYDINTKTGGSNGATMRFHTESSDAANNGLDIARDALEPIREKHPWISYGDLWTLAGVVAIKELGGPTVPWKPGRIDATDESAAPPNGRLPDAEKDEQHIRQVFNRMGFNDREIVALIGAHCLGRCHKDRSGYEGAWTFTPTRFNNQFYVLLLSQNWTEKVLDTGVKQFKNDKDTIMMLPADYAFFTDPEFKKIVEEYAKDKQAFFNDFAAAFGKLLELGVPRSSDTETATC
ncbi:mitochondrial putative cytochrome c peroxidase [Glomus cerebriforme]|uniref:Peroxidase n=1 Tax=Glomus cerebriforme TaxID=658196 RepID=A0A397TKQ9_9GLOM|nr:mitochondrial putative cytochrome c peroxidase [Glomus cerebriforme]